MGSDCFSAWSLHTFFFRTEIFEESIVLIFHEKADVILTRKYVNRDRLSVRDIRRRIVLIFHERADVVLTRKSVNKGRLSDRDIRRKHCSDLS